MKEERGKCEREGRKESVTRTGEAKARVKLMDERDEQACLYAQRSPATAHARRHASHIRHSHSAHPITALPFPLAFPPPVSMRVLYFTHPRLMASARSVFLCET